LPSRLKKGFTDGQRTDRDQCSLYEPVCPLIDLRPLSSSNAFICANGYWDGQTTTDHPIPIVIMALRNS